MYGYFEARIKAADIDTLKLAPAFWLAGSNPDEAIELDVVELLECGDARIIKTNSHIFKHEGLPREGPQLTVRIGSADPIENKGWARKPLTSMVWSPIPTQTQDVCESS